VAVLAAVAVFAVPAIIKAVNGTGSSGALAVIGQPPELWNHDGSNVPVDAPDCPAGMTPLSWTDYSADSVLVCRGSGDYSIATSAGLHANRLEFTSGGYKVTFTDGSTVDASLDGALVAAATNNTTTVYVARESWSFWGGAASFTNTPNGLNPCPSSSYAISLSTWDSGWIMVCGSSTSNPTYGEYMDVGFQGASELSSVAYTGTGYCGDDSSHGQTVCVYQAPAVVTIGDTQHSVPNNYFAGSGAGGAGMGVGSYQVPAPNDTARDQVRYLVDILNRSSTQRQSLTPAAQNVIDCKNLPTAIGQINNIAQNRTDLMSALDSAPVDQISGGDLIVGKLRAALQSSINADLAWVGWGQSQLMYGCSAEPQSVKDAEASATAAKGAFCDAWQVQIANVYGVPAFTKGEI